MQKYFNRWSEFGFGKGGRNARPLPSGVWARAEHGMPPASTLRERLSRLFLQPLRAREVSVHCWLGLCGSARSLAHSELLLLLRQGSTVAACWAVLEEVGRGQSAEAWAQLVGERLRGYRAARGTWLGVRVRLREGRGVI